MVHLADSRLTKAALTWIVLIVSLALLTPWGISHRQSLEPRFELIAIIGSTLSGAVFLVQGVLAALSKHGGWRAASVQFCLAISLLLVAATFAWAPRSSPSQTYTLGAAVVFMIAAVVMQQRARERAELQ